MAKKEKPKLILPEGFDPYQERSPLEDIYGHAFPLADKLSLSINESAEQMMKEDNDFKNMSDVIIVHSVALMLIICMMNREVLESNDLDMTFRKVKGIVQDYLKHILTTGKDPIN